VGHFSQTGHWRDCRRRAGGNLYRNRKSEKEKKRKDGRNENENENENGMHEHETGTSEVKWIQGNE